MKNEIVTNIAAPENLERLYRRDKFQFEDWLVEAIKMFPDSETLKVWHARVNYTSFPSGKRENKGLISIFILSLLSFTLLKLPSIFQIQERWFYSRFSAIIVIISLIIYFLITKNHSQNKKIIIICCIFFSIIFMGLLPNVISSQSILMSQIHMPLFLLSVLSISFINSDWKNIENWLTSIRYLGEMIIYVIVILIGGIVLTFITIELFHLIGISIENWYIEYIVILGLASAPIVATYLYDIVLKQKSNIANIIANTFSPLFLVTVVCYLIAMSYAQKSPYSDRDFLITFNGLLIAVWAITVFSISGIGNFKKNKLILNINISLIVTTLIINGIALSAILFRVFEYGISPNKVVVSGANILIFTHLIVILIAYFRYIKSEHRTAKILTESVANFLPIYTVWSLFVVAILPFIFNFK